jgi:hypothetical protein
LERRLQSVRVALEIITEICATLPETLEEASYGENNEGGDDGKTCFYFA